MFLNWAVLCIIGLCGGIFAATGFFALITMLGVINRFAENTRTAINIVWYEECVILGVVLGNIWFLFEYPISIGNLGIAVIGFFGGIYGGCLSVALAETMKAIPIMLHRFKIQKGLGIGILIFSLGKGIGSLIYFFILNYMGDYL